MITSTYEEEQIMSVEGQLTKEMMGPNLPVDMPATNLDADSVLLAVRRWELFRRQSGVQTASTRQGTYR